MQGQDAKAEQAILTALFLAPNNRFVLRSSVRFFVHIESFDKALFYLRKSDRTKYDPWLISAHIATSSLMDRYSPLIKNGQGMIKNLNYSNFDLTELNSSIGTLELMSGTFKKAKTHIDEALKNPNDNSLAQIEWMSKHDNRIRFNPFNFTNVINPFEAFAIDQYRSGDWESALINSLNWFVDMPYSKRPILLGSYIAGSLLNNKELAIKICQIGLRANPNDPTILNNIIYSIATSEDIKLLDKYTSKLENIDLKNLSVESQITFQATLGLIYLKKGEKKLGIDFYTTAMINAKRVGNEYLENLALINLTLELTKQKYSERLIYIKRVESLPESSKNKDVDKLRKQILSLEKSNH